MKFRCERSFEHSGVSSYTKGRVYDIAPETAHRLAALDSKRAAGAMEYFTPVDEEAADFMKKAAAKREGGQDPEGKEGGGPEDKKHPPTKAELAAMAAALGITLTGKEKYDEIIALIKAKKAETPDKQEGGGAA